MALNQVKGTEIDVAAAKPAGGPRTEEGKQVSKRNALQHGFSAGAVEVPDDEREAFEKFSQQWHDQCNSLGVVEVSLIELAARNVWKHKRIVEEENRLASTRRALRKSGEDASRRGDETALDEIVDALEAIERQMCLLARYSMAADRNFHKAYSLFVKIQSAAEALATPCKPPEPPRPSYAPRRQVPSNVQPRVNPPAPNELPSKRRSVPQTTVEPSCDGFVNLAIGRL